MVNELTLEEKLGFIESISKIAFSSLIKSKKQFFLENY
jgi:hypothetical protein